MELKEGITRKLEGVHVKAGGKKVTLHVVGLDAVTTENEIIDALNTYIKAEEEISYRGIRPSGRNKQIATLIGTDSLAKRLIQKEDIKIGWETCWIRERIQVTRCYTCLGIGHLAKTCKNALRINVCLKCGKYGQWA